MFALNDAEVDTALGEDPNREFVPDPLLSDSTFRTETMLNHLVAERLYLHDLRDGSTIETLGGKKLNVRVKNGE